MFCPNCGENIDDKAVICTSCGVKVSSSISKMDDFSNKFKDTVDYMEKEITNKNIIYLKNQAGLIKECKVNFSWTQFFFGFFVPLFRKDLKFAIIQFIGSVILAIIFAPLNIIFNLFFAFKYNKLYISELLDKGYFPADNNSEQILINENLI